MVGYTNFVSVTVDPTREKEFDMKASPAGIENGTEKIPALKSGHDTEPTRAYGPKRSSSLLNTKNTPETASSTRKIKKTTKWPKFDTVTGIGGHAIGFASSLVVKTKALISAYELNVPFGTIARTPLGKADVAVSVTEEVVKHPKGVKWAETMGNFSRFDSPKIDKKLVREKSKSDD